MLEIKPENRFSLAESIILQAIPELEHYYAFDTENGDHYELNRTAFEIIQDISPSFNFAELTRKFIDEYGLHPEQAEADLYEVIRFAVDNKIIREVSQ